MRDLHLLRSAREYSVVAALVAIAVGVALVSQGHEDIVEGVGVVAVVPVVVVIVVALVAVVVVPVVVVVAV